MRASSVLGDLIHVPMAHVALVPGTPLTYIPPSIAPRVVTPRTADSVVLDSGEVDTNDAAVPTEPWFQPIPRSHMP